MSNLVLRPLLHDERNADAEDDRKTNANDDSTGGS